MGNSLAVLPIIEPSSTSFPLVKILIKPGLNWSQSILLFNGINQLQLDSSIESGRPQWSNWKSQTPVSTLMHIVLDKPWVLD